MKNFSLASRKRANMFPLPWLKTEGASPSFWFLFSVSSSTHNYYDHHDPHHQHLNNNINTVIILEILSRLPDWNRVRSSGPTHASDLRYLTIDDRECWPVRSDGNSEVISIDDGTHRTYKSHYHSTECGERKSQSTVWTLSVSEVPSVLLVKFLLIYCIRILRRSSMIGRTCAAYSYDTHIYASYIMRTRRHFLIHWCIQSFIHDPLILTTFCPGMVIFDRRFYSHLLVNLVS